jgi:hypothetical protein
MEPTDPPEQGEPQDGPPEIRGFGLPIPADFIKGLLNKLSDPNYGKRKRPVCFLSDEEVILWNKLKQSAKEAEEAATRHATYKDNFWSTVRINHGLESVGNLNFDEVTQQLSVWEDENDGKEKDK